MILLCVFYMLSIVFPICVLYGFSDISAEFLCKLCWDFYAISMGFLWDFCVISMCLL